MVPAVASTPTWRLRVMSPITSTVGLITPSTLRDGSICGRSFCCMVRSALADAVLQAMIISGQPLAKSARTACRVNS